MDNTRAGSRLLELLLDPLAQVGIRAVLVVRQLGQDEPQLTCALRPLLADEASLDDLLERAMRHRHRATSLSLEGGKEYARTRGEGRVARPVPPLPRTLVSGSGGLAVFLAYGHEPAEHAAEASSQSRAPRARAIHALSERRRVPAGTHRPSRARGGR